jgi:archaetidylinositol phosphate synthase
MASTQSWRRISRLLTKLKQRVQAAMACEAQLAHRIGLSPNIVSVLGFLAAVVATFFYWFSKFFLPCLILASVFLLVSGFFDALDGVIARLFGKVTVFGGFLDSMLDRYADGLVLIGIIVGGFADALWGLIALMGSLLVSYGRARAEAAGVKMETIGLAERAERILILFIASFLTFIWSAALWWSIVLLAVLTNVTVFQRVAYFRKASKKRTPVTPVV